MAFITTDDINFIIIFILPGYVSLVLYHKISLSKMKLKEFDKIIWSIIFSTIIFFPYSYIENLKTISEIIEHISLFRNFLIVIIYSIVLGTGTGLIERWIFKKDIVGGNIWGFYFNHIPDAGEWIGIRTKNNNEYIGKILVASKTKENHGGIIISNPKLIKRNQEGNIIQHINLGGELLILEKEIETLYLDIKF